MTFEKICIQRFGADPIHMPVPPEIERMRASAHPFAQTMATVLEATIKDAIAPEERPYVEAIEARRASLEEREDEITYLDFGAATKYGEQSAEEMYTGVERSRSVGHMCRRSSKPYRTCLMLMKMLRSTHAETCLELGTGLGLTACYQAAALELKGKGRVISLEGPDSIAAIAQETADQIGHGRISIEVGRWQDTLERVVAANRPIHCAFIDGHHDRDASMHYFDAILPGLADGAIFILDDIRWSEGMLEAWNLLKAHPQVEVSIDLVDTGVCWIAGTPQPAEHYSLQ